MSSGLSRRAFLANVGLGGLLLASPGLSRIALGEEHNNLLLGSIPSTGERIPAIGMGTWITFNVGTDPTLIKSRTRVLATFLAQGGSLIDCSPMYGTSADVLGQALASLEAHEQVFSATKIWTSDGAATVEQARESRRRWGVNRFDLLQVHNLRAWQSHLPALFDMKERGEVKYVGITTSHGRQHDELARIMENEPLDFVQLTYNLMNREAERRLLPIAKERGIAVIANRPFKGGQLFQRFQSKPLPSWASDVGAGTWAEFFLKFIISHPAVTCAIPATSDVDHMRENMGALRGRLPDSQQRQRMADYVRQL